MFQQERRVVEHAQEIVSSASPQNTSSDVVSPSNLPPSVKGSLRRPQTSQGAPRSVSDFRPTHPRRTSQTSIISPISPASQAESWRSKAGPLPLPAPRQVPKVIQPASA